MGRPSKYNKVYYNWESVPIVINVKEAAAILRCSTATVQSYIRQERLKATKCGNKLFISKDNLKEFMNVSFAAATGGVSA